jgi:hypothetical protein
VQQSLVLHDLENVEDFVRTAAASMASIIVLYSIRAVLFSRMKLLAIVDCDNEHGIGEC